MSNKRIKKKISKILALILSISIILNCNVAYSIESNSIKNKNSFKVYETSDIRLEDDFYEAINGEWIRKTKSEMGNISYGTFDELSNNVSNSIDRTLINIKKNRDSYKENDNEVKVLNLYENYMNINERNRLGIKPIEKYIKEINNIKSLDDLKEALKNEELSYFQSLINFEVGPDYKNSNDNILYISRSTLGLGNSDYYKTKNNKYKEIKNEYIKYLTKLHILSGETKKIAKVNVERFYELEQKMARKIPSKEEESADPNRLEKSYNIYTISELEKEFPNIEFKNLFLSFKLSKAKKIVVEDPEELKLVNSFICEENLENMKSFLLTNVLMNTDSLLTSNFRTASNDLKKSLYGIESGEFNDKSGVKFITYQLDELVSKLYVDNFFDEYSKYEVEHMAEEIIDNFEKRISNISWMSNATKLEAINKLQNVNIKIGYPNYWNDYSSLKINRIDEGASLVENIINIYLYKSSIQFNKLNKPVDKNEWSMGACIVNAYYNPTNNEIVFPAGILQSPFYDKNATKEKNLGGIGAVIGHELTHAFDNTGAQFDEEGKLNKWWTDDDYIKFTNRSKNIARYYSNIEVEEGKFVNGNLTVGENISDLGGVACILDIAKKIENPNLKELFENYAIVWRDICTNEMRDFLLNNDTHSPKKIRVNEVLAQFEEFYKTYNIKESDKMYVRPEERIGIW